MSMKRAICTACVITLAAAASKASAQTVNGSCWVQGERADLELRASPFDSATVRLEAGEVKVCFSRPRTLGRPIIGRVVPFGRPWRMGADEATSILLPTRASVAGLSLEPGWYSLYAIPGEREWRIVINADVRRWGTPIDEPVRARDIASVVVPVEPGTQVEELLSMRFGRTGPNAAELVVRWDRTAVRVPVVLASH
jgi:hypothetical protein